MMKKKFPSASKQQPGLHRVKGKGTFFKVDAVEDELISRYC
jgi:hypothetical protein